MADIRGQNRPSTGQTAPASGHLVRVVRQSRESLANSHQSSIKSDENLAVGKSRRCQYMPAQLIASQHFGSGARLDHQHVSGLTREVDSAVSSHRRRCTNTPPTVPAKYVAAAADPQRHLRTAAVAASEIDDAVVIHRCRLGGTPSGPVAAPQQTSNPTIGCLAGRALVDPSLAEWVRHGCEQSALPPTPDLGSRQTWRVTSSVQEAWAALRSSDKYQ